MRISRQERRTMQRRMRQFVAPALRAGLAQAPKIVLVLATHFSMSSQAMAQIQLENRGVTFTRTWSKEDLQTKAPTNPVPSFGELLESQVKSMFTRMKDQQNGNNRRLMDIYNAAPVPTSEQFLWQAAAFNDHTLLKKANEEDVKSHLQAEAGKAVIRQVESNSPLLERLRSGFNFNFDIGAIFSDRPAAPVQQGSVRYGLILKDIEPDADAAQFAAVSTDSAEYLKYAGVAEVKWTIGQIDTSGPRKAMNIDTSVSPSDRAEAATASSTPGAKSEKHGSLWDHVKMPSLKFRGNMAPVSYTDIRSFNGGIPAMKIALTQDQGLLDVTMTTKTNLEQDTVAYGAKVPLAGTMAVGRRFDDKFQVVQTSAYGLLVDSRAPMVNIHYAHLTDQYSGELTKDWGVQSVAVKAETPTGWEPDDLGTKPGEKYTVEYKLKF